MSCLPYSKLSPSLCLFHAAFLLAMAAGLPSVGIAQEVPGPNLFDNPNFAHGLQSWKLEIVAPAAAVIDGLPETAAPPRAASRVARINVSATSSEKWHAQFYQTGLDLMEGEPYTLAFWARAER